MKTFLIFLALLGAALSSHRAGAQSPAPESPTEAQALTKQLNLLMRNPKKPKQDVTLTLKGCLGEQLIRDRGADVQTSTPLAFSFNHGNSGWAMRMDNGVFEMRMSFSWADITTLTYEPATDDNGQKHFQIKLINHKKGNNTNFEMPLYTTDEATVKQLVARLDKVRRSCGQ